VTPVRAAHVTDLRAALNEVFDDAGRPRPTYTDPTIAAWPGRRGAANGVLLAARHLGIKAVVG